MDFVSESADTEPDPADPGGGPGRLGQLADELRQGRAGRLADIDHAERGALSIGQLMAQTLGQGSGIALGEGGGEAGGHDRPPSRSTMRGAMRSTIAATPRALGWRRSGWLRSGSIATPSRKNG